MFMWYELVYAVVRMCILVVRKWVVRKDVGTCMKNPVTVLYNIYKLHDVLLQVHFPLCMVVLFCICYSVTHTACHLKNVLLTVYVTN